MNLHILAVKAFLINNNNGTRSTNRNQYRTTVHKHTKPQPYIATTTIIRTPKHRCVQTITTINMTTHTKRIP